MAKLNTTEQIIAEFARVLDQPERSREQWHLIRARACLVGARVRLATFRRLGDLNGIDRDLHVDAVQSLYHALDLVWAAQQAVKSKGQIDYEADVAREPTYRDGAQRKTWDELPEYARWSWEHEPANPEQSIAA